MALGRRGRLGGWSVLLGAGALALVAWGLAAVLFTRPALKALWDLSPQARFTVDDATKKLLAQLADRGLVVEFHTVFEPLPRVDPRMTDGQKRWIDIQRRVQNLTRDLLRQYAYLGGDAVRVTHHDLLRAPKKVREVAKLVELQRTNSVVVKIGKRSKVLWVDGDLADVELPGARPQPGIPGGRMPVPILKAYKGEEAISSAIRSLLVEGTPVVYFLEGYGTDDISSPTGGSYSELAGALSDEGFQIRMLDLEGERQIPDDAAVVALIDPHREMSGAAAETLVAWVRRGGRVLINVGYWAVPADWNVRLDELGRRLGFELSDDLVCELIPDPMDPRRLRMGPQTQNLVITNLNPVHPVTRPLLNRQRYPRLKMGREIRRLDPTPAGVRVDTSFLRTGPRAWLERRGPDGQPDFVAPSDAGAFTSRSVGAVVDVDAEGGGRTGHVVVVAAFGFENLGFKVNGDFALNLFNWLAERRELVRVRGQRYVAHRLELAPQQVERLRWLLVGGVPGGLVLLGLLVFWRRRSA